MQKFLSLRAGIVLAVLTSVTGFAQNKDILILGTATPGGGFPVYGEALAETVNRFDPTLQVQPRNTKGSTENVPLLETGKLDIALVQGEVAQEAFSDIRRGRSNLKIIVAMYSTPGLFAVRADSPYTSIRDLIGRLVAFGARGSGLVILARYVLEGIGLDQDRDFQAIYLDRAGDGPVLVQDSRAAALWGGGLGWPGFDALAKIPEGARFIAPSADEIERILAKYSSLRRLTIPAGSYPGQTTPIPSVGSWSFVLARPDLADDLAYRITRALHRGEATMGFRLPQARETTLANTIATAPSLELIHPGTLRYLREIGMIR
jgi:uncharacterized protein